MSRLRRRGGDRLSQGAQRTGLLTPSQPPLSAQSPPLLTTSRSSDILVTQVSLICSSFIKHLLCAWPWVGYREPSALAIKKNPPPLANLSQSPWLTSPLPILPHPATDTKGPRPVSTRPAPRSTPCHRFCPGRPVSQLPSSPNVSPNPSSSLMPNAEASGGEWRTAAFRIACSLCAAALSYSSLLRSSINLCGINEGINE